jgi:hypothetical protein
MRFALSCDNTWTGWPFVRTARCITWSLGDTAGDLAPSARRVEAAAGGQCSRSATAGGRERGVVLRLEDSPPPTVRTVGGGFHSSHRPLARMCDGLLGGLHDHIGHRGRLGARDFPRP